MLWCLREPPYTRLTRARTTSIAIGFGRELFAIAWPWGYDSYEYAVAHSQLIQDRLGTENQQLERVGAMGTAIINGIHAQERFLRVPPARGTMVGSPATAEHRQH